MLHVTGGLDGFQDSSRKNRFAVEHDKFVGLLAEN